MIAKVAGQDSPVFIVGCPRSGTTLLRNILASHSRIIVSPESHFFNYWLKEYGHLNLSNEPEFKFFWQDFSASKRFGYFNLDPNMVLMKLKNQNNLSFKSVFEVLMAEYAATKQKPRWGEKTPAHYDHLNTIFDWFPDARIIWLIRDPRAVTASLLKVDWASKYTYANAYYWLSSARLYLEDWQEEPRIFLLKYEDLVRKSGSLIEEICQFLGENFEPCMISQRSEKDVSNPFQKGWAQSHFQKAMQPIGLQAIEKWREELSHTQVSIIEDITRDNMLRYGYIPITTQLSPLQKRYLGFTRVMDRAEGQLQKIRSNLKGGPSLAAKWVGATTKETD